MNKLIVTRGVWQVRLHINPKAQQYALYCNGDYFSLLGENGTDADLVRGVKLAEQYASGDYTGLTKREIKQIATHMARDPKFQQFPIK